MLAEKQDLYGLGYGLAYPIALEGALKLKEVTYVHREGMVSTGFKHGPLSAVHARVRSRLPRNLSKTLTVD